MNETNTDTGDTTGTRAAPSRPATDRDGAGGAGPHRAIVDARRQLAQLVAVTRTAATSYGRPDLAERLDRTAARIEDGDLAVIVVGEFKQGKSTLINALLNAPVCGIADDVSTVVPTTIRYGDQPAAIAHFRADGDGDGPARTIPLAEATTLASEQGNPGNRAGLASVEVRIPRKLLRPGLALVDTPGVGGLDSAHGAAATAALGLAELVVFVSDASQPLTESEVTFLEAARSRCPHVVLVQPKTDIQPDWRRVVEANEAVLAARGLAIDVYPVSSVLRQRATTERSTELNEESGFPALLAFLRDAGTGDAAHRVLRTALADATFVIEQLEATFRSELAALDDPESAAEVVRQLEEAKERADHLRGRSAKWQQTLNDGYQDLASDTDHDLRVRFRAVVGESDAALDDHDPATIWDEFEQWLHTRIGFELSAHHQLIAQRANELAADVADHFAADEEALGISLAVPAPTIAVSDLKHDVNLQRAGLSGNALAAVRGSYGGLLMFGMMGQMAGLAMINPLSIVVGLGLGRRGLREEKRRQLTQRQQQAKMTVRRYVDDVQVEAAKTSRDTVRHAHRELRDEFAARADQLQATIRESLRAAESTMKEAIDGRQARLSDTRAELERIALLRGRADAIEATIGGTGS